MTPSILVQREATVATVILNRADKLNALDLAMWSDLGDAFTELDADTALRCVVIRGVDAAAFSAGADIQEFPELRSSPQQARAYADVSNRALRAIAGCRHPTLAAIAGVCVGGGLELATMCDMRICAETSRFGIPVSRLGLTMNHCEFAGLFQLVGRSVALELLFEGRVFGAAEALQKRLVNRVVADDALAQEVAQATGRIAAGAPLSARWHKKFACQFSAQPALDDEALDEGYACFGTEDYRAGYQSFLAKARPVFQGR